MRKSSEWVDITLRFAGIVNVMWGLIFALFTNPLFRWAQLPEPTFVFPWQLLGIVAVILGLAYYIASFNIARSALIIVVGLAFKIAGTVAVWKSVLIHDFSWQLALYFSVKDLLWLVPFVLVLVHIFRKWQAPEKARANPNVSFAETLASFRTNRGQDLRTLSYEQSTLVTFLPHPGSPWFSACVAHLSQQRKDITQNNTRLVLVYPVYTDAAHSLLQKSGLAEEEYIVDTDHTMSNTFNLKRAALGHVFSLPAWRTGWLGNNGINTHFDELSGGGFRMPASFLVYRGELLKSYHYERPDDHPDYALLAER